MIVYLSGTPGHGNKLKRIAQYARTDMLGRTEKTMLSASCRYMIDKSRVHTSNNFTVTRLLSFAAIITNKPQSDSFTRPTRIFLSLNIYIRSRTQIGTYSPAWHFVLAFIARRQSMWLPGGSTHSLRSKYPSLYASRGSAAETRSCTSSRRDSRGHRPG